MLLIIGTKNCPRCKMTKSVLNNKDIEYEYKLNDEISKKELDLYLEKAKEKGLMNFPLIIKDEEIITVEDIIK
jgi:glutaredoxin